MPLAKSLNLFIWAIAIDSYLVSCPALLTFALLFAALFGIHGLCLILPGIPLGSQCHEEDTWQMWSLNSFKELHQGWRCSSVTRHVSSMQEALGRTLSTTNKKGIANTAEKHAIWSHPQTLEINPLTETNVTAVFLRTRFCQQMFHFGRRYSSSIL